MWVFHLRMLGCVDLRYIDHFLKVLRGYFFIRLSDDAMHKVTLNSLVEIPLKFNLCSVFEILTEKMDQEVTQFTESVSRTNTSFMIPFRDDLERSFQFHSKDGQIIRVKFPNMRNEIWSVECLSFN